MTTYIIAADAARARILVHESKGLREIDTLVHPESQQHAGDLRTGGKGEQGGGGDTKSQHQTGNVEATADKHTSFFAKEVAEYLHDARTQGKADSFMIVAEPQFLGALRKQLDAATRECVIKEVDKDLSRASTQEIAEALDKP
ncbi:Protein required for attachment to host cells [Modicisalibacter muralis]|uniref:Protein required for attachment to host cells n=1 Tax=Modicisalibacter muralis TaxID=119000 RepID=A0A1G9NRK1_9GAMM|nr:host attachment protein [Halomonas muralis]SDL89010.1 Protein required for attachment to host cells [Halomonas muralis]